MSDSPQAEVEAAVDNQNRSDDAPEESSGEFRRERESVKEDKPDSGTEDSAAKPTTSAGDVEAVAKTDDSTAAVASNIPGPTAYDYTAYGGYENYLKMCQQATAAQAAGTTASMGVYNNASYAAPAPSYGGGGGGGGGGYGGPSADPTGRELCRDYVRGRCGRTTCHLNHVMA